MWLGPIGFLRRGPTRAPVPAAAAAAVDDAAERAEEALATDESDRLLCEIAGSALLVARGGARSVIVCNAPASIDFDEVGLIADTLGVRIEPVVRVGGGGFDFRIRSLEPAGG